MNTATKLAPPTIPVTEDPAAYHLRTMPVLREAAKVVSDEAEKAREAREMAIAALVLKGYGLATAAKALTGIGESYCSRDQVRLECGEYVIAVPLKFFAEDAELKALKKALEEAEAPRNQYASYCSTASAREFAAFHKARFGKANDQRTLRQSQIEWMAL